MASSIEVFNRMASDIGVIRYNGESEDSFVRRTVFSSSRFVVEAICLDDGNGGRDGVSRNAINIKLKKWIKNLDGIYPGIEDWMEKDAAGSDLIYKRMIDIGDLIQNGFEEAFKTHGPEVVQITARQALITGFYDPTIKDSIYGWDHSAEQLITSGLCTISNHEGRALEFFDHWWVTDLDYLPWEPLSTLKVIGFVDLDNWAWGLRRNASWTNHPTWIESLTLVRQEGAFRSDGSFFVARKSGTAIFVSQIDRLQAQELYYFLKKEHGHPIEARIKKRDRNHSSLFLPFGVLPSFYSRFLSVLVWPIENQDVLVRSEVLPILEHLLEHCFIDVKG